MRVEFAWASVVFKLEEAITADLRGHTIYDLIYTKYPEQAKPRRPRCRLEWFPEAVGKEGMERQLNGFKVSSQGDRDIWNQTEMLVTHLHECTKCHKITCFKTVNFKFYDFCLSNGGGEHIKRDVLPQRAC